MLKRIRGRRTRLRSSPLGFIYGLMASGTLVVVALVALTLTRDGQSSSLNGQLDEHVAAFQEGPATAVGTPDDLAPVAGAWLAARAVPEGQAIIVRTFSGEVLTTPGGFALTEVREGRGLLEVEISRRWRVETEHGVIHAVTVPLLLEQRPVGTLIAAGSETKEAAILDTLIGAGWAALAGLVFAGLAAAVANRGAPRSDTAPIEAVGARDEAGGPVIVRAEGAWEGVLEGDERWIRWQPLLKLATIVAEVATIFALVFAVKFGVGTLLTKRFRVWSNSMVPTLTIGQQILVDRVTLRFDRPDRGDIVVFKAPGGATSNTCGVRRAIDQPCPLPTEQRSDAVFIKRVVGLPGDRLKVLQGLAYIDGKLQSDPKVRSDAKCDICNLPTDITVPPGHFFVMGDNRAHSDDSRYWGPVPGDWLVGRAFFSYWPPSRFGRP